MHQIVTIYIQVVQLKQTFENLKWSNLDMSRLYYLFNVETKALIILRGTAAGVCHCNSHMQTKVFSRHGSFIKANNAPEMRLKQIKIDLKAATSCSHGFVLVFLGPRHEKTCLPRSQSDG